METSQQKKSVFTSPFLSSKIKKSSVSLFPEAGLGYLIGPLLALISNGVVNIWLIQYWDKVLRLKEWNPLFETLRPIISSIIIVIGNLFVGKLREKKPTLAGKARPFILLGRPLIAVALLVLFLVPLPQAAGGTSSGLLVSIVIAIGYNLYYALAWPIYYTSHSALVNLSTRDGGKRGLLSTCIRAAQLGASGISGRAGGLLVDLIGLLPKYSVTGLENTFTSYSDALSRAEKNGLTASDVTELISPSQANSKWTLLRIIRIVCLVIGCLLEYYFTRERITEENIKNSAVNDENETKKGATRSQQRKICVHDRYWWLIIVFFFLYQFGGQRKNNDRSFYSQARSSGTTLSSIINTVGAIPTALGRLIVWPLANKFSKSKTIAGGSIIAFLGSLIAFICLRPSRAANESAITALSVTSFCVKALGSAPARYVSLALLANVLDHQEALYGKRTDGFTRAVYGSIMVAMSGICNGIIAGLNAITPRENQKLVHTILGFLVEGVCYAIIAVRFIARKVEKFTKLDNETILENQKAICLKEGKEWVSPEERAKKEDEENEKLNEEARVHQLKIDCEKKHLDFEKENEKYLARKAKRDEESRKKKEATDRKKKEAEKKKREKFDSLPEEKRAKILAKQEKEEKKIKDEYSSLLLKAQNSGLAD